MCPPEAAAVAAPGNGGDEQHRDTRGDCLPPLAKMAGQARTGVNPYTTAWLLTKECFFFISDLLATGYKRPLVEDDLYAVMPRDSAETCMQRLKRAWDAAVAEKAAVGETPTLVWVLLKEYGLEYFSITCIGLLEWAFGLAEPLFAGLFIDAIYDEEQAGINATVTGNATLDGLAGTTGGNATAAAADDVDYTTRKWAYVGAFIFCALCRAFLHHPMFQRSQLFGMRLRIATTSLIYQKTMALSTRSLAHTTTGHLVNLISNDSERFDQACLFIHFIAIGVMKAGVVSYFAWRYFGGAGLVGVGMVLLMGPLQYAMSRYFISLRAGTTVITDTRVKIMNEVIQGIRLIKMYAWEVPFSRTVGALRTQEENRVRRTAYLRALNLTIFHVLTPLVMFTILTLYVWTHSEDTDLKPSEVFSMMIYVNVLGFSFTLYIPFAVQQGSELLVSLRRIQELLLCDEFAAVDGNGNGDGGGTAPFGGEAPPPPLLAASAAARRLSKAGDAAVEVVNVDAAWPGVEKKVVFERLNLRVAPGALVGIVGGVGCGKTSLLALLTGELPVTNVGGHGGGGQVLLAAPPTLAPQESWILSGTARENILFGREYDAARYRRVVDVCCLENDFRQFPDGDRTAIGERGITLSGGQRARLSLARACYEGGPIMLLDDPLSAVDAEVGRRIFDECINGFLAGATRILVTHQHQYLAACDAVYTVRGRGLETRGTVEGTLASILLSPTARKEDAASKGAGAAPEAAPAGETLSRTPPQTTKARGDGDDAGGGGGGSGGVAEDRGIGAVTCGTYGTYFKNGGVLTAGMFFVCLLAAQACYCVSDAVLAAWTDRPGDDQERGYHYTLYGVFLGCMILLSILRAVSWFTLAVRASTNLHNKMFTGVLYTAVSFLDTNPSGRVLNRFSKDVGQLDEMLPWSFYDTLVILAIATGSLLIIGLFNPWVILGTSPVIALFLYCRHYFVTSSREIKRLEAIGRSPLYSTFSETIHGVTCIRAYRRCEHFLALFKARQDDHTSAFYLFHTANRWLGLRLDLITWLFISVVAVLGAAVSGKDSPLTASEIGVSLAYATRLSGAAQWAARQSAETEAQMTAAERIRVYGELQPEPGAGGSNAAAAATAPPDAWPTKGAIEFKDLSLRYRPELPLVLRNLSFTVPAGCKVGIVGRTGAGKSSITQALFRLAQPAGGTIVIDGVDTADVPLHDLRSRCSIIPQDPVLFTGTMRYNLDPFGAVRNERTLWKALEDVQLKAAIEEYNGQLDCEVSEGGRNFSVGQRQLICLARALLRNNRILVLDEATANVDPETDRVIQEVIRDKFRDCTVLTIAHRLHTVIDADRILLLRNGEVVGWDEPAALLADDSSLLSAFVRETGVESGAALRAMAEQAAARRREVAIS